MIACPVCNATNQTGALFCEMCGHRLPTVAAAVTPPQAVAGGIQCPTCKHIATAGEAFCDECGTPLNVAATAAVPVTPAPVAPSVQPAPQPTYPAPQPIANAASPTCPSCRAAVIPGEAFCDNCGASLLAGAPAAAPAARPVAPAPQPSYTPPVQAAPVVPAAPVYTPPPAVPAKPPVAAPVAAAPVGIQSLAGFVLVTAAGTRINLPAKADIVVGREDAVSNNYPDIDLNPHNGLADGVGRRHARIFVRAGVVQLEDLDSTNGTTVNKQRLQARQIVNLNVGDEIRFGRCVLQWQR
ncbi:double zinc ribbon domain-containing protein [Herpetosiphon llansteffanensis]|uniref:double zinc ribbon domain-containing protein n=1 Tax=Herpetosiphon llansteffanensis TaxID=2094568 RepID=UPI000D7BF070|nr:zinc ribbon domain-containing protein [Herpetosiphon llansteffanensis]